MNNSIIHRILLLTRYYYNTNHSNFTTNIRHLDFLDLDLDFADDIASLEGKLESAQSKLKSTAKLAKEIGLEVIIKTTEQFSNIKHSSADEPIDQHEYIQIEGQKVEGVNNFKY